MKKILALILALAMMMTAGLALADNSYTGTGKGFAGDIKVTVTLADDGSIVDVTVDECNDTPGVCDTAVEKVPAAMKELNSINVDTVSGATFTSQGILAAAKDALESNGVDTTALMEKKEVVVEKGADQTLEADVVVIGAGGAGLAAAITAEQNGAKVIVVEKMPKVGGNTILAGGAVNAVEDRSEFAIKQNDSVYWHYTQTLSGGDYQGDPELVRPWCPMPMTASSGPRSWAWNGWARTLCSPCPAACGPAPGSLPARPALASLRPMASTSTTPTRST